MSCVKHWAPECTDDLKIKAKVITSISIIDLQLEIYITFLLNNLVKSMNKLCQV